MKFVLLPGSALAPQRSESREMFLFARLARTQSEPVRWLALATGFRLVRSFEINRIAAPESAAGLGWTGLDG